MVKTSCRRLSSGASSVVWVLAAAVQWGLAPTRGFTALVRPPSQPSSLAGGGLRPIIIRWRVDERRLAASTTSSGLPFFGGGGGDLSDEQHQEDDAAPVADDAAWATVDDLNMLVTEYNVAVATEAYGRAGAIKARLDELSGGAARGDWAANGVPRWLQARLTDLGARFPTPIQGRAMREGFALSLAEVESGAHDDDDSDDDDTHKTAAAAMDVLVRAPTGSGKTLAFLVPMFAALTAKLEDRERDTYEAVANAALITPAAAMEALSPALRTTGRMAGARRLPSLAPPRGAPLALILSPSRTLAMQHANTAYSLVGGNMRSEYFPGDRASLFAYTGPKGLRLCAVASEADARHAVLAAQRRRAAGTKFERDDDDLIYDDLHNCDILCADAATLRRAAEDAARAGEVLFDASNVSFVAIDEADACGDDAAAVLEVLDVPASARRVLVGATLNTRAPALAALLERGRSATVVQPRPAKRDEIAALGETLETVAAAKREQQQQQQQAAERRRRRRQEAAQRQEEEEVLVVDDEQQQRHDPQQPASLVVDDEHALLGGAADAAAPGSFDGAAWRSVASLPPGLRHRYCVVEERRQLGVAARLMREDLDEWRTATTAPTESSSSSSSPPEITDGGSAVRPRCVVVCRDEAAARRAAPKLRTALWGDHAVVALLPTLGAAALDVAQKFALVEGASDDFAATAARDGASVLVTAPSAARGLDFPNVTHVFLLGGLPAPTADEPLAAVAYAHVAGRAGRVGQRARGVVTTLCATDREAAALREVFARDFPAADLAAFAEPSVRLGEDGNPTYQELEDLVTLYYDADAAEDGDVVLDAPPPGRATPTRRRGPRSSSSSSSSSRPTTERGAGRRPGDDDDDDDPEVEDDDHPESSSSK